MTAYAYTKSLVMSKVGAVIKSERGQGMVEYALILVLVSIVVIAVLGTMGNNLNLFFNKVASNIH